MRQVATIAELREVLDAERARGRVVGFVPTMGYLHEGHVSLMRTAGDACDVVVTSIFVNPLQFAAHEDLDDYPRDLQGDASLAEGAGVELLFVPAVSEMYPDPVAGGLLATTVSVAGVSAGMEGASRPTHFAGVATVVAKLFAIVGPCRAFFGEKDYQQLAVVRRMVADLSMPVEVVGCETVREPDGLAMSSRNAYLSAEQRTAAPVVHRALRAGAAVVLAGERDPAAVRAAMAAVVAQEPLGELDYAEVVSASDLSVPTTLEPTDAPGDLRLLAAVRFGSTRLIDNLGVTAPGGAHREELIHVRRRMMKSKIHRATVTDANLHYVGSVTVDEDLLDAADIMEFEQVAIVDVDNGARLETYTIAGPRGSGVVCLNGAAARLVSPGDKIIMISYADYEQAELAHYAPVVVHVDTQNSQIDEVTAELLAEQTRGPAPHRYIEVDGTSPVTR